MNLKKAYETFYNVVLEKKAEGAKPGPVPTVERKVKLFAKRNEDRFLDPLLETQLTSHGRLLAAIASRPGQTGRADGYILEGKELEFYQKHLQQKKKGRKA